MASDGLTDIALSRHCGNVGPVGQNGLVIWTPMGRDAATTPTLVDGVPTWMRSGMKEWLRRRLFILSTGGAPRKNLPRVRMFDQLTQQEYPLADIFDKSGFDALEQELSEDAADENLYITFLDFLAYAVSTEYGGETWLEELEGILIRSGSKWTVGTRGEHPGLEDRVPAGVRDAAEGAMATPGHAGDLLSKAWHAAYGVSPKPEFAYTNAVLAVEAAAIPVVTPSDRAATLGKVFAVMRDQGGWGLEINKQHADYPTSAVVLGMVQMLWAGQGRHAGQPDWTPNSQSEAEAAVMLAVPLVQWFTSGALRRRT